MEFDLPVNVPDDHFAKRELRRRSTINAILQDDEEDDDDGKHRSP